MQYQYTHTYFNSPFLLSVSSVEIEMRSPSPNCGAIINVGLNISLIKLYSIIK